MFGFLKRRAKPGQGPAPLPVPEPSGRDWAPPAPSERVHVIGDVHGRIDLLDALMDRLGTETRTVLVGDYVDRGPDSAAVLTRARDLAPEPGGRHEALLGNHEVMLLEFIDDPAGRGTRWLRFGGEDTLRSFGVEPPARADLDAMAEAADALSDAMGPLEGWLRALPTLWTDGTLAVAHAGCTPGRAMDDQPARALLWGGPGVMDEERGDGVWVAHGHVVVERAYAERGRIAVDTGAAYGRPLTAAVIEPGAPVRFEEAA